MILLVRNEADLIKENVEFHLRRGVDHFIVTDNGSTDATVDLLQPYIRSGLLTLLHEPEQDYSQSKWVTRMAMIAARDMRADWILSNDADEFWWCGERLSLKDHLKNAQGNIAYLPRQNMLPSPRWATGSPLVHMTSAVVRPVEKNPPSPTLGKVGRKIVVQSHGLTSIAMGNHDASLSIEKVPFETSIVGFHYPIRSFRQFEKKVSQGGAALERNTELHPSIGGHWRRWFKIFESGGLRDEYDRLAPSGRHFKLLRREGVIRQDGRVLFDYLSSQSLVIQTMFRARNKVQTF
jgi:hypothetical protein